MMTTSEFINLAREHFEPLLHRHGCHYRRVVAETGSHVALFMGEDRAIEISLDQLDGLLEIYLYKVEDGSVVRNPLVIDRASVLTGFNIDDFLSVSESGERPHRALVDRDSVDEIERRLEDYARAVSRFQDELLDGEFRLPRAVEQRIKERLDAQSKHAGDRA